MPHPRSSGPLRPPIDPAIPARRPVEASRRSLPACASSVPFLRPPSGSKAYFREDHFSGGRPGSLRGDERAPALRRHVSCRSAGALPRGRCRPQYVSLPRGAFKSSRAGKKPALPPSMAASPPLSGDSLILLIQGTYSSRHIKGLQRVGRRNSAKGRRNSAESRRNSAEGRRNSVGGRGNSAAHGGAARTPGRSGRTEINRSTRRGG